MDDDSKKFKLRYVGQRFEGAKLPLDVLSDLPALRDLIAALAKLEFRDKHSERERVPKGFDSSISFFLTKIESGSARPVFQLDDEAAQRNLPHISDEVAGYVNRAYDKVAEIYDGASRDAFPKALPADAIRALSKLGASIHDDESIEFCDSKGADGNVVSINSSRRKALLTQVHETYTVEKELVGVLAGTDTTDNSIKVTTQEYGIIHLRLDETGTFAKAFDGHIETEVEFSITVSLDASDSFKKIEGVHSVDLVSSYSSGVERCLDRIQSFASIEHGWLDNDQGERVAKIACEKAVNIVNKWSSLAQCFKIFPTEDGGVSIEFEYNDHYIDIEIMPDGALELDFGGDAEAQVFTDLSPEFSAAFEGLVGVSV